MYRKKFEMLLHLKTKQATGQGIMDEAEALARQQAIEGDESGAENFVEEAKTTTEGQYS
ncbi:hypothetical protein VP01_3623g1, partial [Puccinia sorghi]